MDTVWSTALWLQFGAAIDMLENAVVTCPNSLWRERLWRHPERPEFAEFWYITYHTLFWLDFYLTASREGDFAPPAPFTLAELDPEGVLPERPYTKAELQTYLAATRQKCRATLIALTDEQARRIWTFPWAAEQPFSYVELQLYSLRHVQEHTAQLSLLLGQHAIPDEALDWVPRAKGETATH